MSVSAAERDLREQARLLVRAGILDPGARLSALVEAVRIEMPDTDADIMARAWLAAAGREVAEEAVAWPSVTDHDRLLAAFAECQHHGVLFLVGEIDAAAVRARVDAAEAALSPLRGIGWFDEPAVWHAVTSGVLECQLRHPDGRRVEPEDHLGCAVVGCLGRHGLQARIWEGCLQIAMHWQRRP